MSKRVRHCGNCRGCLHFPKPLVVCEEKGAIVHQRSSDVRTELVAHEWWNRTATQIKVVLRIERCIAVEFGQRSMEAVGPRLGDQVDDASAIPTVVRIDGLG